MKVTDRQMTNTHAAQELPATFDAIDIDGKAAVLSSADLFVMKASFHCKLSLV